MTAFGSFLRRNFEPLILSAQVFVDLGVLILSCWLGYLVGRYSGGTGTQPDLNVYRQVWALMSAVCLVSFHLFGMYSPQKSLLNMQEFKAIAKAVLVSFLVFWTLLILGAETSQERVGAVFSWLVPIHDRISLGFAADSFSRLTVVLSFAIILVATTASRFASFKYIQSLHRRGIGNRNVLIYGAGECGRKLQAKFMLVPTLGLNLVGLLADRQSRVGEVLGRNRVLGSFEDLERVIGEYKVSEVFVAMPDHSEDRVMEVLAECERIGVRYHVVPRFYHLLSYNVRIESLDSIPLITRADRRTSAIGALSKRSLDLFVASLALLLGLPIFLAAAIMVRRESSGPAFFVQERIGRNGTPFRMFKFRTMHQEFGGNEPAPASPFDPRVTRIGRFLRRYSLDELPQFLNVFRGEMSIVGPRPEMKFIVDEYGAVERERLRVKPGITGLWQISYARQQEIHDNLDYDLYYIEHQSLLLDIVIIALTGVAVAKGTGAY
ncbi:MAG: sugar transferase [bacterium]|nr:sugar transferase [Planctomycetota bacterium]HIL53121.1 sugar transferase [Planctomycetota bacterium]